MQQCPPIPPYAYRRANRKYKKNLFDNYLWTQKFKKNIQKELEEV